MSHRNRRRPRRAFWSLVDGLKERTSSAALGVGILPAAFLAVVDAAAAAAARRDGGQGPRNDGATRLDQCNHEPPPHRRMSYFRGAATPRQPARPSRREAA